MARAEVDAAYSFTILTEEGGQATFRDIIDGQTVHEQVDENTGMSAQVIMESPDEKKADLRGSYAAGGKEEVVDC